MPGGGPSIDSKATVGPAADAADNAPVVPTSVVLQPATLSPISQMSAIARPMPERRRRNDRHDRIQAGVHAATAARRHAPNPIDTPRPTRPLAGLCCPGE